MRWRVRLSGEGFLLQQLPKLVAGADLAVTQDAERTYLEAASLQPLNDAASVASAAEAVVQRVRAACELHLGAPFQLRADGVEERHPDGTRITTLFLTARIEARAFATAEISTLGATPSPRAESAVERALAVANAHALADRALQLYRAGLDWVGLYKALEAIEEAVGGAEEIARRGWASRNALRRLKHTANSLAAVGVESARHGAEQNQPPANPMSLAEAQALVESLLRRLLT